MAKFITGKALEDAICSIILDAKERIVIVSPFIKLDAFFMEHFKRQMTNSQVNLLVVFGKNEQDKSKSLNQNDFEFFKNFPNISIIYVPNLHAKYYGNERKGVITSINLYDHSFRNNIEFGVFSENTLLDKFTQSSDQDAWSECLKIADDGEPVFIKRPVFKKKMLIGKDYINSSVLLDNTAVFYASNHNKTNDKRKLRDFADEIDHSQQPEAAIRREDFPAKGKSMFNPLAVNSRNNNEQPHNNNMSNNTHEGYCIRTGAQIAFNPSRPFSAEGYKSWAQFGNWDYSENYCHRTGRKSHGKTSMRNPILN